MMRRGRGMEEETEDEQAGAEDETVREPLGSFFPPPGNFKESFGSPMGPVLEQGGRGGGWKKKRTG